MLRDKLGKELLFFDGGMGTLLQKEGMWPGEYPETWNIEKADKIKKIHQAYYQTGSRILLTNTFGANRMKYKNQPYTIEQVVYAAVQNVRSVGGDAYVALDVGPTGKLLKPMGDLDFEEAYETFKEVILCGMNAGVDLIHIETMSDTYELKAAVLAAKENTNLPVFATVIFDDKGKLLTGGDVPSVVALLEGLRVDALGINCGMGPEQMIPIVQELRAYTSLPIIVKPNAGLPKQKDGETFYDIDPNVFAEYLKTLVKEGACIIGGCCGTTPEHIKAMVEACQGMDVLSPQIQNRTLVSSYGQTVELNRKPVVIGERINPTGKSKFKQALKDHNMDYILKEAVAQQDKGAHILDVNVGLPDIDEVSMMREAVMGIQSIVKLPLQIDSVNTKALEAAMRIYNGKPMINSVSGKQESMDAIFPLVQKYGGVVVGLTLDEEGIPETADGRVAIAGKIINEAKKYGIDKKDIVIDVLTMTISSEPTSAKTTLEALKKVRDMYGVCTVLGVSNISFGLPNRPIINSNFYTMALQNGLNAGIINPSSESMMQAYYSYCALMGYDANCETYIEVCGQKEEVKGLTNINQKDLRYAIEKGLKEEAQVIAQDLVQQKQPLEIIQEHLIPALDMVGKGFEKGTVFLPQLLMSAEAAKEAFEVLKLQMNVEEQTEMKREKIILATVKGDIHDIGKNIVKVLLENYNFDVIDLGKDVAPEKIVETAKSQEAKLVGLSALMTTTVVSMEETIRQLREELPMCKIMVGGAVMNAEYANMICADFYGKDAMQSVYYAQKVFAGE